MPNEFLFDHISELLMPIMGIHIVDQLWTEHGKVIEINAFLAYRFVIRISAQFRIFAIVARLDFFGFPIAGVHGTFS